MHAPETEEEAVGDMFNVMEANTRGIVNGEISKGLPGSMNMARIERDIRNLGDPVVAPEKDR